MSAFHPWSDKEIEFLERLLARQETYTYSDLADELNSFFKMGRSAEAVRKKIERCDFEQDPVQDPVQDHVQGPTFQFDEPEIVKPLPPIKPGETSLPPEVQDFLAEEGLEYGEVKKKDLGNNLELIYVGPDIKTVEDLMKQAKLPEEDWIAVSVKPNHWGTAMKLQKRKWIESKEDYVTAGWTVIRVPIYQIKASFIRKKPEQVEWPLVQPVQCNTLPLPDRSNARRANSFKDVHRDLIVSDAQIGF